MVSWQYSLLMMYRYDQTIMPEFLSLNMSNYCFISQSSSDMSSALQTIDFDDYSLFIDSSQAQMSISAPFGVVRKCEKGTVEISSSDICAYFDSPRKK
ncbi:unnamed protein product [Rotaria sordida]|uniref:Uncharacterized protein n=1 Tax=Rotaria sordida TaxID=392033 RepID=A0A818TMS4_9BILA|nr:unnamed protein product [Rotaria sordida]CAF3630615.1 unnamed protein product [Rotaria sordida]CAF3686718.1 unnamed protein product [Rotaria sordida]